MSRCKVESFAF